MIDLFGLGPKQEQPSGSEPAAEPPRGSHTLWAFLLVLDSAFVIIFAGAVAAKVYQYWRATASPVVTAPRRRPPREQAKWIEQPAPVAAAAPSAPIPVSTHNSSAQTQKAPEPAAPPESKTPAKTVDAPRPPKPSLLAEAPKRRETPRLADPGAQSGPAAPAVRAAKALPVEFKLRAPRARGVQLVGAFIVRGGRKDMIRHEDGTWSVTLYLNPGQYRYFFAVDKRRQLDSENPHSERGFSMLSLP